MRDTKATLALLLIWACVSYLALSGLAHGAESEAAPGPIQRELGRIAAPAPDGGGDHRSKRLRRYAVAIESAAEEHPFPSRLDMTAALIAIGEHESHFDEEVCEDFTRRPSVGCWQLEVKPLPESVEEAAMKAAYLIRWAWRQCGSFEAAVALYATGRKNPDGSPFCGPWLGAAKRVRSFRRARGRI